jgi:hypothetical protein
MEKMEGQFAGTSDKWHAGDPHGVALGLGRGRHRSTAISPHNLTLVIILVHGIYSGVLELSKNKSSPVPRRVRLGTEGIHRLTALSNFNHARVAFLLPDTRRTCRPLQTALLHLVQHRIGAVQAAIPAL